MSTADQFASFFQKFDFHLLDDQERKELLDFYSSLIKRHKAKKKPLKETDNEKKSKKQSALLSFSVKPFEPLKREQIYVR